MNFVRTAVVKVECNGLLYWHNEYQFLSDALLTFHAVDDVLSSMMAEGIIGEYNVTLIEKNHVERED